MKKFLSVLLSVCMLLSVCAALAGCGSAEEQENKPAVNAVPDEENPFLGTGTLTLNVYNWGEYISDGFEGSLDTVAAFEEWFEATYGRKVKVNYSTFASNEDMYSKLSSDAVSYDVIIPSDYMIAKMISEDMLLPLNYENIPNYQYINESFRGLYYDPDNLYTVPYTYGVVGIIYDANVVDPEDVGDWDLLWNEKYSGKIMV